MLIGGNIFKILNIVIQIMRMISRMMGDDEDKKQVDESVERSKNGNGDAC